MGMSKKHKLVFDQLNSIAQPGDILFMTSQSTPEELPLLRKIKRRINGYNFSDRSDWHTALYLGATASGNAEIMESIVAGVRIGHLPSNYYTHNRRLELGRIVDPSLDDQMRQEIIGNAKRYQGCGFDRCGMKGIFLERIFGIPNILSNDRTFTCQGLVLSAYEDSDIYITPSRYNGIVDHDLYRLPNLEILLGVEENKDGTIQVSSSPGKYSWQPELRRTYKL